jgi:hypothetical protein
LLSSLQDIAVPALVAPTAPAGEQKAPGWTTAPEPELVSALGAGLDAGFASGLGAICAEALGFVATDFDSGFGAPGFGVVFGAGAGAGTATWTGVRTAGAATPATA